VKHLNLRVFKKNKKIFYYSFLRPTLIKTVKYIRLCKYKEWFLYCVGKMLTGKRHWIEHNLVVVYMFPLWHFFLRK